MLEFHVMFYNFRYVELLGSVHGPPAFGGHMGSPPFGSGFPGGPMTHPPIGPGMPGPIGQTSYVPGSPTSPTGHMPFGTVAPKGPLSQPLFGTKEVRPVIQSKPPP